MKIEKVNENQICCTLTREDLENRQIKLSELAYGSEKAKMLFRDMIQQANYEFGFEANDIPLMVEAIPMEADAIILLITKIEYPEELDTRFSQFSDYDEDDYPELMDEDEDSPAQGADDILGLFQKLHKSAEELSPPPFRNNGQVQKDAQRAKGEPVQAEVVTDLVKMFEIRNLDQAEQLSHVLSGFYKGENALYRNVRGNCLELVLHKSSHSPEEFNKVCNIASEYARQKSYTPAMEAFYEEHRSVILEKDALRVLDSLSAAE